MAHVAVDLDGTISAAPYQFETLLTAFRAAGHRVTILTGTTKPEATQDEFDKKVQFLCSLGCAEAWDDMVLFAATDKVLSKAKAKWLRDNSAGIFIDNNTHNADRAIPFVPLVLVPWASRKE